MSSSSEPERALALRGFCRAWTPTRVSTRSIRMPTSWPSPGGTSGSDPRVTFHVMDGADFISNAPQDRFDLIYADAWPGKFTHLDETLSLLRVGGIYFIDDLLPQPNWPEGHAREGPGAHRRHRASSRVRDREAGVGVGADDGACATRELDGLLQQRESGPRDRRRAGRCRAGGRSTRRRCRAERCACRWSARRAWPRAAPSPRRSTPSCAVSSRVSAACQRSSVGSPTSGQSPSIGMQATRAGQPPGGLVLPARHVEHELPDRVGAGNRPRGRACGIDAFEDRLER